MSAEETAAPRQTLSFFDGVVMVVGMVVGIGIFATPSLVAQFAGNGLNYLALWLAGGLLALNGALCYAELATRFPSAGGEYNFLARAYGKNLALLFAWARCSVIQTGSIALVAFVYGDYAQSLLPLGEFGAALHAAIIIVIFTTINMAGTFQGALAQKIFTSMDMTALLLLVAAGCVLILGAPPASPPAPASPSGGGGMIGLAVVFVMLTYGGWNESAYLSAELKNGKRSMVRVLVISILLVTTLYFAVAFIYLKAMGFEGLTKSSAIAADVMRAAFGSTGAAAIALFVCGSAISTLNATIFTGGRIYYALGRDLPWLAKFGRWDAAGENPAKAFLLQGAVALALVLLSIFIGENGFRTMVDYTAPVFWLFMTLIGISLFLFRHRGEGEAEGYCVPFYPVTPLIFVATCLYMLWSSVDYVREGSLAGLAVLLAGVPLLFFRGGAKANPAE
jgi:basic amino acid/polyamine antiporter, APA family